MAESESSFESSRESAAPARKPPPELEARQSRPRGDDEGDEPKRPYGAVYLIERQAIELRRMRVIEAEAARLREKLPPGDFEFSANDADAPSPREELERYRRPDADPMKSHAATGLAARAAAWLRRAFWGE